MESRTVTARLLGRDRAIVAASLLLVVAASAAFIVAGAGTGMSTLAMTADTGPPGAFFARLPRIAAPEPWTPAYALTIFAMWWLMMVAMMLPSAAPVVLLHGALFPGRGASGAWRFLSGYLSVWAAFSAVATAVQGGLAAAGMISSMYMTLAAPVLAGAVLVAVGAYQATRFRAACLDRCRSPADSLTRIRRTGRAAAFRMGLRHGTDCLGCCWALMALLFVGGVMNLWWIGGIALYVAAEKLTPWGPRLGRPFGAVIAAAGLAVLAASVAGV